MRHVFRFVGVRSKDGHWQIEDDELFQITHVVRLKVGDFFELTDGLGYWCRAVLQSVTKKSATWVIDSEHFEEPPKYLWRLALGAIKSTHYQDVLPELVELGIHSLDVFYQSRTEASRIDDKAYARVKRLVRESCKVAKRCHFPDVKFHDSLEQLLRTNRDYSGTRLVADPSAHLSLLDAELSGDGAFLVVGGERGLDESEISILVANEFAGVSLGRHVLRAKTAMVAAASVLGMQSLKKG